MNFLSGRVRKGLKGGGTHRYCIVLSQKRSLNCTWICLVRQFALVKGKFVQLMRSRLYIECILCPYVHFGLGAPTQSSMSESTEFQIRYRWPECAQPPSILMGYWWSEWILVLRLHETAAVRETSVCWPAEIREKRLKQDLLYTAHSQKSMKAHTNGCGGYTLPAALHLCASASLPGGMESSAALPKQGGGEETLPHGERERPPRAEVEGWNNANKKKIQTVWTRDGGGAGRRSWEAAFPGIYKSSILRAAQAACVSEEWIRHIVNNWCASKHRRYVHTWSEYINSSHVWREFIFWRTAFNLLVTLDQLNINLVFLVISAVKLKLISVQMGGGSTYRSPPGNENAYVSIL